MKDIEARKNAAYKLGIIMKHSQNVVIFESVHRKDQKTIYIAIWRCKAQFQETRLISTSKYDIAE